VRSFGAVAICYRIQYEVKIFVFLAETVNFVAAYRYYKRLECWNGQSLPEGVGSASLSTQGVIIPTINPSTRFRQSTNRFDGHDGSEISTAPRDNL
jgi:hypothetical protein